jgi:hypothetical protein
MNHQPALLNNQIDSTEERWSNTQKQKQRTLIQRGTQYAVKKLKKEGRKSLAFLKDGGRKLRQRFSDA